MCSQFDRGKQRTPLIRLLLQFVTDVDRAIGMRSGFQMLPRLRYSFALLERQPTHIFTDDHPQSPHAIALDTSQLHEPLPPEEYPWEVPALESGFPSKQGAFED